MELKAKVAKLECDIEEIKKRSQSITNTQDNHSCQILDSSLEYSESQVTSLYIGGHTDKETLTHCETNDSVTTNITSGIDGSAKCIVNSFNIKEVSQHLAQLCDKTMGAEDQASKANYEEIICWSLYGGDFEFQLMTKAKVSIHPVSVSSKTEVSKEAKKTLLETEVSKSVTTPIPSSISPQVLDSSDDSLETEVSNTSTLSISETILEESTEIQTSVFNDSLDSNSESSDDIEEDVDDADKES
ncbi:5682_t:CDS:2 [Scutellospora calospora]|uniref:5682_t:CDS:1 n=1 Tax=Scutellospora calospora TaxID=85575 RepID=A0ACA9K4F4_9GLOM|nr:5682_t:CDS:2 [Scutellospora calospora]